MQLKGKRDQDMPNRASNMEPAEGSRERMTNSGQRENDRGTSTDRAMFDDESEPRPTSDRSSERGSGMSGDQREPGSGISNRGTRRERKEQEQLPERGKSQSER